MRYNSVYVHQILNTLIWTAQIFYNWWAIFCVLFRPNLLMNCYWFLLWGLSSCLILVRIPKNAEKLTMLFFHKILTIQLHCLHILYDKLGFVDHKSSSNRSILTLWPMGSRDWYCWGDTRAEKVWELLFNFIIIERIQYWVNHRFFR